MRVSPVSRPLLASGVLLAGLSAGVAPAAAASGWSATPALPAAAAKPQVAALADDGSAAIVSQSVKGLVVRTGSSAGGKWRVRSLARIAVQGSTLPPSVAAAPGGAVLVVRSDPKAGVLHLDTRTSADAAWRSSTFPATGYGRVAADPTGGWVLVTADGAGTTGRTVATHLAADGTPDAPVEDLGPATGVPDYDGEDDGTSERALHVDASGRAVLMTAGTPGATSAEDPSAVLRIRPHGGVFGAPQPYGQRAVTLGGSGIRISPDGRIALAADAPSGSGLSAGAAGVLPPALTPIGFGGETTSVDAVPVGADRSAAVWSDDQGDDCGEKGERRCGAGGGVFARTFWATGMSRFVRLSSGRSYSPVISPLNDGRALIAWEQATGGRRNLATWHARLVGQTGRITSISAPRGKGSGYDNGITHSVVTNGRWAMVTWSAGPGKPVRVTFRKF